MNLTNLRFLNLCYNPLSKAVHFQESKLGPTDKIVENILPLDVNAEVQNKDTNKCRNNLESCYFDELNQKIKKQRLEGVRFIWGFLGLNRQQYRLIQRIRQEFTKVKVDDRTKISSLSVSYYYPFGSA